MQCGRLPGLQASSFLDFSRHKRQRTHEEGTLGASTSSLLCLQVGMSVKVVGKQSPENQLGSDLTGSGAGAQAWAVHLSHQGTPQHSPSRPAPKKANEGSAAVASHMGSSGQFDINSAESLASRGLGRCEGKACPG
eukprot:582717-Pelagomonas_calceolata.AAC.3